MSVVRVGGTGATSHDGNRWIFDNVQIDLSDGITTAVTKIVEIEGENLPSGKYITIDSATQATATIRSLIYSDPSTIKGSQLTITPTADVDSCTLTLALSDLAYIILNCVVTQPSASITGLSLDGSGLAPDSGTKQYRGSVTLTSTSGTATLVVNGTHLNRMLSPVVSGAQNCNVQVTQTASSDTQNTYTLAITNVTAGVNGGATITIGDATLILSVVAPAPSPIVSSVRVAGFDMLPNTQQTVQIDDLEQFVNRSSFDVAVTVSGSDLSSVQCSAECYFYRPSLTDNISPVSGLSEVSSSVSASSKSFLLNGNTPPLNSGVALEVGDYFIIRVFFYNSGSLTFAELNYVLIS